MTNNINGVGAREKGNAMWRGLQIEYGSWLPVSEKTPVVTLREGNTPMIHSEALSKQVNANVWLKFEGANPTGSFKDRGMFLAISKAKEEGAQAVICASTGNTSAAAAAYAAKAGLVCGVLVPDGKIAMGKLAQALMTGAKVLQVKGNFDEAFDVCKELAEGGKVTLVNSVNPYRIEGQKTGAFEVIDFLGEAPDIHVMPVGNAGNITAYWKGYKEYKDAGISEKLPTMRGFQASGSAPIVTGERVKEPKTIASAIAIGNPSSWQNSLKVVEESKGSIRAIDDKYILDAYRHLALTGVFAEPSSCISIAGLLSLHDKGEVPAGSNVVCVLTGHGLKDPDWAIRTGSKPTLIEPSLEAAIDALELD